MSSHDDPQPDEVPKDVNGADGADGRERRTSGSSGDQAMRKALNELDGLRARVREHSAEVQEIRLSVRGQMNEVERAAREEADAFAPTDIGAALQKEVKTKFPDESEKVEPQAPPTTLEAARDEWSLITSVPVAPLTCTIEESAQYLLRELWTWNRRPWLFRHRWPMPTVPETFWAITNRLQEIYPALPALREKHVADALRSHGHLPVEMNNEIERLNVQLKDTFVITRDRMSEALSDLELTGSEWTDERWFDASATGKLSSTIRVGTLLPDAPQSANIPSIPALLDFPLRNGVAVLNSVSQREKAVALAQSMIFRTLLANQPGDVRFSFFDPVSVGQSVAEFRHLSEFDSQMVDIKTWTSERDIEAKLGELSDHLEVVISSYLRGQFESIDEYNREAGEVAEPYRVVVVFDFPEAFSDRAARQLLSIVENGPRCGVFTILLADPSRGSVRDLPLDRLTHSMQKVDLTNSSGRIEFPEPIGALDLDFVPDPAPPIEFDREGKPRTPFARLLIETGDATRTSRSGPVTLERVLPIVNKIVSVGRADRAPQYVTGAGPVDLADSDTWWAAESSDGAYAPIGRAGAQDVAAFFLSSTEIAGGGIVVGLPRSGKSTSLHATVLSLALLYPPDEVELYLIDSKHGVEFKIYESLPHARLVSIHSEPEFSTAILQSLDQEIKRRAELMKREAAGRTNISEYRAATGKKLPRIVLIMDEFHELFEEDNEVSRAAFQAFSNIVRMGPFAGVHIIVASQSVAASMPALDKSVLRLLPMRVAFMCTDEDADAVMGIENREVHSLSEQGQGIFNRSLGAPSHNQPFRGVYVPPQERDDLLRKVEAKANEEGFTRAPRVFDGDNLAPRPTESLRVDKERPVFRVGEPFGLEPFHELKLRRGRASNLLLLGRDGEEAKDEAIEGVLHSCIADAAAASIKTTVVDFIGNPDGDDGSLDIKKLSEAANAEYVRSSSFSQALAAFELEIEGRRAANDYDRASSLLVLCGLERALDLDPEDFGASSYVDELLISEDGDLGVSPVPTVSLTERLEDALRTGPEFGCHVIGVVDSIAQFERRLGSDALKEFEFCVAGSGVSSDDIARISDSYKEPELRQSQLVVVDRVKGKLKRVRAFPKHNNESIALIVGEDRS